MPEWKPPVFVKSLSDYDLSGMAHCGIWIAYIKSAHP